MSPLRWTGNDAGQAERVSRLARQIVGDHLDVLIAQRDRDFHHGAQAAAAPHPGAEVGQGLRQVVRPLAGQPGGLALAGEILLVAAVAAAGLHHGCNLGLVDGRGQRRRRQSGSRSNLRNASNVLLELKLDVPLTLAGMGGGTAEFPIGGGVPIESEIA